jgi:hypothetical protein
VIGRRHQINIAAISRRAYRTIADSHTDGCLFVGGVAAPVEFPADTAWSVFANSAEAAAGVAVPLWKVDDPALVGIGNID